MSVKTSVARKAASSVVRHSSSGTVAKAKRRPVRATRLLTFGALVGGLAGYLAGRRSIPAPAPVVHAAPGATRLPPPATNDKAPSKGKRPLDVSAAISAVQAAAAKRGDAPLPPPD